MSTVDIGQISDIPRAKKCNSEKEQYGSGSDDNSDLHDAVSGCYRELEPFLIKLASLYLSIDKIRPGFLHWFSLPKGSFQIALGADGAPFGKHNQATAWLVSFLNVADRIASRDENHLICGANCSEEHPSMIQYAKDIRKDIESIEKKSYSIEGENVKFSFELIPADMKWLAFISGELPNSATYFSSFANVKISENAEMGHTFGEHDSHFKPWNYKNRLNVVKLVEKHKTKLTQKQLAARTKVTEFIASQNSRQEFEPLLGPVIDKAVVEPLHLANNNWQFLFSELFTFVLHSKTVIPSGVKSITDLAKSCCLRRFLTCLKRKVKANRLYKSILRWFREGRKTGAPFHFRFTGEETRLMCNGFCKLVHVVLGNEKCNYADLKVFVLSFMAVNLRDAVSVFSRITDMEEVLVAKLNKYCVNFFNAASLFVRVTVSAWTLGYVVPVHAKVIFDKYNTGLGLNTMQGREAKHQKLAELSKNTTYKKRWQQIFRHEYMSLIWLREQNPYNDSYCKTNFKYIPARCNTNSFCHCGLMKDDRMKECQICCSSIYKEIIKSVEDGSISKVLKKYLPK